MLGLIHGIKKCDQGATAVEYSLIASLYQPALNLTQIWDSQAVESLILC